MTSTKGNHVTVIRGKWAEVGAGAQAPFTAVADLSVVDTDNLSVQVDMHLEVQITPEMVREALETGVLEIVIPPMRLRQMV